MIIRDTTDHHQKKHLLVLRDGAVHRRSERNGIRMYSLWTKEEERVVWILCALIPIFRTLKFGIQN